MDYGDYYWGLYGGDYMDPFPHSLLSTRQEKFSISLGTDLVRRRGVGIRFGISGFGPRALEDGFYRST